MVTEKAWQYLNEFKTPRLIAVNKLDRENSDFYAIIENIKNKLKINPLVMQIPIGREATLPELLTWLKMRGFVFSGNEAGDFMRQIYQIPAKSRQQPCVRNRLKTLLKHRKSCWKITEGQELSAEEISSAIKKGIVNKTLIPVLCVSALSNIGIKTAMDALVEYLPSPLDREAIEVNDPKTKEKKKL